MPIINSSVNPHGPIIGLAVGVSESRRQYLLNIGKTPPAAVFIRALVDTGASSTHVVDSVIAPLGLTTKGPVPVITASTGSAPVLFDEYDVSLTILHPEMGKVFEIVPILACEPLSNDYQAMLGRDILQYCSMFYNGPDGTFSLAF
jgi:hypothetical protein